MNTQIREILVEKARNRDIVYYKDIAPYANVDLGSEMGRREIGRVLGEISRAEFEDDRPLLSAIVVSVEQDIPGEGFFELARELGLYRRGQDKDEFQMAEMNRVHDYWENVAAV